MMISCVNLQRLAAVCAAIVLFSFPSRAQQGDCLHRTTFANVLDERGLPVRSLSAGDFRASIRGKAVSVTLAQEDTQPRHVLLLFDTGESMRDTKSGKWPLALEIANHVVQNSPKNSDLKLAIFGKPGKIGGPTPGDPIAHPTGLTDLFNGFALADRAVPHPPLYDALADSLRLMDKSQMGDVIFIVTDGGEENSKTKPADLQRQLLRSGLRVFAVTLPMRYERSGLTVNAPAFSEDSENTNLMRLLLATGGKIFRVLPKFYPNEWGFHFDDKERMALATSLQLLYLQMAHFYRLEITLPQAVDKSSPLEIVVVGPDGKTRKSLRLVHPQEIDACTAPAGK